MTATPFEHRQGGRLSTLQAALVVARRDFTAILFSRSFIFFLLGPLFTLMVGGLAGESAARSRIRRGRFLASRWRRPMSTP